MPKSNDTKYKNDYNKEHYARLSIVIPIEEKTSIENFWKNKKYKSFNAYVTELIKKDMDNSKDYIAEESKEILTQDEERLLELYRQADSRGKRKIIGSAELEVLEQEPVRELSASKIG